MPGKKRTKRAPTTKKKTTESKPPLPDSSYAIRTGTGQEITLEVVPEFPEIAMRWSYIARNRRRWLAQDSAKEDLRDQAYRDLGKLGVSDDQMRQLARAGIIEVSVPFRSEDEDWAGRVLPWEFVISSATRRYRGSHRLTIVRHLRRQQPARPHPVGWGTLFVASTPGRLDDSYDFKNERLVIRSSLSPWTADQPDTAPGGSPLAVDDDTEIWTLSNPTLARLNDEIMSQQPVIVHLSGVDSHHGAVLLGEDPRKVSRDGFYLKNEQGDEEVVDPEALGRALGAAASPPRLVFFNAYNSAARLAALAVAEGAGAAIGFQAEIDDALAELFAATFYRAWRLSEGDTLDAFDLAWQQLRTHPALQGSGVVLWSEQPLVVADAPAVTRRLEKEPTPTSFVHLMQQEMETLLHVSGTTPAEKRESLESILAVEVESYPRLNYSVLHNNGDLFRTFDLRLLRRGILKRIEVRVELHVGSDVFPYRASFDLDNAKLPSIKKQIRVPLTWDYVRGLKESVRSSVYVRVSHDDVCLYEKTHQITLDPVEEWIDTEINSVWLPSFVLPRDPVVARIVDQSRRYLAALVDDVEAGFDGYQSVDEDADDPAEFVDLQVRALWTAIVQEYGLSYINPPPSYTFAHQRLRKPTAVCEGRAGTCIDLALLLASCLEYVEIYPVIFLLKGHAFPGYWRSEESYQRFLQGRYDATAQGSSEKASEGIAQTKGWVIRAWAYNEIVSLVKDDDLVPLESVGLTRRSSFLEGFDLGVENLQDIDEFEAMIDVRIARDNDVTPLPL